MVVAGTGGGWLMTLFLRRLLSALCSIVLVLEPFSALASPRRAQPISPNIAFHDPSVQSVVVKIGSEKTNVLGLSVQKPSHVQIASLGPEVTVSVSCHNGVRNDARLSNVTARCAAYSVVASEPVSIGIPYDLEQIPSGASEREIRLFKQMEVALAGPMAPVDSYLDLENRQTIATLAQQSGRFISAVLKPGERSEKPPSNISGETLKSLRQADPMLGLPIIPAPTSNNNGDLRLSYPLQLPGVRDNLRPQLSVGYSAQAGSGNIAVGWNLSVPAISVETRWGVPAYDPKFETEVYLFNGEQLVPEAGESFVDAQSPIETVEAGMSSKEGDAVDRKSASLHLVPQPHRTVHLRPRKTGKAHFVMRRDEGLWRFVRHGDAPASYWWEAWQENPSSDVVRVMYFGRAPGKLVDGIEPANLERDMRAIRSRRMDGEHDTASLRLGPLAGLANPMAISKWGLSRDKDSFGNIVDYEWVATCLLPSGEACASSSAATEVPVDRDLYLKRVIYTGHQQIEETILRCRERPDAEACRRRQGLYELNLFWTPDHRLTPLPRRVDARSGGLVVSRRLLERAEVRFRRRQLEGNKVIPLHRAGWACSVAFLGYEFSTRPDPLFPVTASLDGKEIRQGAPNWLSSITKHASRSVTIDRHKDEDAVYPSGLDLVGGGCEQSPPLAAGPEVTSHTARFDYQQPAKESGSIVAFGRAAGDIALPAESGEAGDRIKVIRGLLQGVSGIDGDKGPFAASRMGSVETESFNAGIYVGIGGAIKGMSQGYKFTFSKRTSHKETTLFLDIDGDGISDILVLKEGRWLAHRGKVDANRNLSFDGGVDMRLPPRFRFQYEPVQEATNDGPETHLFGAIRGHSSGRSHTVQTVQLADMDGDGRVDIVTPGGVFYNTTTSDGAAVNYQFTANTPFLLNGTAGQPAVAPVATPVPLPAPETFPATEQHPRYDAVRTWRAPFRGLVRVTGQARLIAPDEAPDEVWGTATPAHDAAPATSDELLPPAHRDGVIVRVERSSGATVRSCGAGALGPRVLDRLQPPQPGGPGLWTLLGTRLAPRDAEGAARLDYRLSVSGRKALGPSAAAEEWSSAIIVQPAVTQTAITQEILARALKAAAQQWNDQFGKDAAGRRLGKLVAAPLAGNAGVKVRFKGIEMAEMPPLRFSVTLPNAGGVIRAGLQLADPGDGSGSLDSKHFKVDARVVPAFFDAGRDPGCAAHPDLAAVEEFLQANGVADGLIVAVERGDVLYFRVHSVDNGDDDVVTWTPQISYLSAEEESLPVSPGTPGVLKKLIGPGLPQSPDSWIAELAKLDGSRCTPSEKPSFCDGNGRSLLRYRLNDAHGSGAAGDLAPLALPNAGFIAPMTGAVEISGALEKPATVGPAVLDYVVVPVELLATQQATHIDGQPLAGSDSKARDAGANPLRYCDADATRAGRSVSIAGAAQPVRLRGGRLVLEDVASRAVPTDVMAPQAGAYTILRGGWNEDASVDPVCRTREGRRANPALCAGSGNEFDIRAGDKICLFVRSRAPQDARNEDAAGASAFWPIDAAGFKVPGRDGISLRYKTEYAPQAKMVPSSSPLVPLPLGECIDPGLGDRPRLGEGGAQEPSPGSETTQICRSGNNKHYILPAIQHGAMSMSSAGHVAQPAPSGIIQIRPVRAEKHQLAAFSSRMKAPADVPLPAQACQWGPQQDEAGRPMFERRFLLDLRGIATAAGDGSIALLDEPSIDPVTFANRVGAAVAKLRSRILAFRDGQSRILEVKRFAAFAPRRSAIGLFRFDPVSASAATLAGGPQTLPDGRSAELIYDPSAPTTAITQSLHFLRGTTGTLTLSPFMEQRESRPGVFEARPIQLPSTQAGFAVCAAEDEELVVEAALDDAPDASPVAGGVERLLATNACEALPRDALGRLDPSELDSSTAPLTRGLANICPLGTARLRLATVTGPGNFDFDPAESQLALASKAMLAARKPASGASLRWRMPHEALTDRGVALVALRHGNDAVALRRDFRDPVDACAEQNLAAPLPQEDEFLQRQRTCQLMQPAILPSDDPQTLTPQQSYPALRDAMDAYNAVLANPTDEQRKGTLHPPVLFLAPEQRYPTAEPKERKERAAALGAARPAIPMQVMPARLCNAPAVPRGPIGTSQAAATAIEAIADNTAINPSLESKVTWATADVAFQAATGSQIGLQTYQCLVAPDAAIWGTGDALSASRYGAKDIHFGSKFEAYSAAAASASPRYVSTSSRGAGLGAPVRRSDSRAHTTLSSLVGISSSATTTTTTSDQDVVDLNGDGYPDTLVGNALVVTDARGGNRCGPHSPWAVTSLCRDATKPDIVAAERFLAHFAPVRSSFNETRGSSFGFPAAKKSAEVTVASARATFTGSMSGLNLPAKGQRSQESYFPLNLSVDQAVAEGTRLQDVVDVNGDGLPDIVRCNNAPACTEATVHLNLGNKFDTGRTVSGRILMGDHSRNIGLGLSIGWGYPLNDNSLEGGLAAGANSGDITRTFVDVNGDGLPDILSIDPSSVTITANLNTGWGFSDAVSFGKADFLKSGSFGRSETDNASAGGAYIYSYCWPLPPICIHVNPNAGLGAALTRQSIIFRDADGDGLADFIAGDSLLQSTASLNVAFSRKKATVVPNRLAQHGLLVRVWQPTNPSDEPTAANLEFNFTRTGRTVKDPQNRWVLAQVTTRDGVAEDDAKDVSDNSRHTCFAYADGAYDRFERQFLGYAHVAIVEGCRPGIQDAIQTAGPNWRNHDKGLRRTERRYANGSVYEAGLLVGETTFDTSTAGATMPLRSLRQTYVLADTALSSHARPVCHHLRSEPVAEADKQLLALGFVRNVAAASRADMAQDVGCRTTFPAESPLGNSINPTFDTMPRRLTPALVQAVRETWETASGAKAALRSALQFDLDHVARPRRACDLGEVTEPEAGHFETRGAVCSDTIFDDSVRPRFTHGATGGGTIVVEQRNRIKEVKTSDFPGAEARKTITGAFDRHKDGGQSEKRVLRRRSASHDPQTGTVSSLCQFVDLASVKDPCARFEHFPSQADRLEQASRAGVVLRAYRHDEFGNLERFIGPIGSGGSYLVKAYSFDRQLALVETSERTEHCEVGTTASVKEDTICPSGNKPALGTLRSFSRAIDYRHATPTVAIDLNGNATHVRLDELGRLSVVYANWSTIGPECGAPCVGLDPQHMKSTPLRRIASYDYRIPDYRAPNPLLRSPAAIVTRETDSAAYAALPNGALLSKTIHDQSGAVVQTMEEAETCVKAPGAEFTNDCAARHNYTVSGIILKDRLQRSTSSAFPISMAIAADAGAASTRTGLEAQQPVPTDTSRNEIAFDGLDRPLSVALPDGNAFDFRYRIAESVSADAGPLKRHRTDMRNALCVPSAVERDVRGTIRAVIESSDPITIDGQATAAEGSNPAGNLAGTARDGQPATGLVASVGVSADAGQQIYACNPARGQPFELTTNLSIASYNRDALGQLVAVRLPPRSAGEQHVEAILAGYDPLGRRVLVDDPDRGFERIIMDGLGNHVCSYSGERRKTLNEADLPQPDYQDIRTKMCPDPKSAHSDNGITRLVRSEFLADLPTLTGFKLFGQPKTESERAAQRQVLVSYGEYSAKNQKLNRVGRAFKTTDMIGSELRSFDALGRAILTQRDFTKLSDYDQATAPLRLTIGDEYDIWGLHKSRTMAVRVPGKAIAGRPKPSDADINETVWYRYTPAGQLAEVTSKSGGAAATTVVSGMQYDARGNLLGLQYATGVATSQVYDATSNRLSAQRARLGVGGGAIPPIFFQNLSYRYDPAGNVLEYDNIPAIAEGCMIAPPGAGCGDAVPALVAKAHGLLISRSKNSFAYDQLNRIRSATKSLASLSVPKLDREGEPHLVDDREIDKATKLTLDYTETFAFRPTHEMGLLKRVETRGVEVMKPGRKGGQGTPSIEKATSSFTSVYLPDGRPRHAPGTIATEYKEAKLREQTKFGFDEFGRMSASLCLRSDKKGCWPDRYFDWNADDSLRGQLVEIPSERLPEAKKSGASKGIIYYDRVLSEYDSAGRRTHKKLTEQRVRKVGGKSRIVAEPFVSDTLYADAQLTITRRDGQKPQAIVHYFAGQHRLASKWVGDDRLFTYHAQLLTRNVTDIVVGKPGAPETARLNGQQEYAAFGQILHQRETLLSGNPDGVTSGINPGLPRYRFNAKEQDESGLQDFGARFYDNRLALWLRPDPVLHDYLDGRLSGGVFASKNLASYGFGWGNPVGYIDRDGNQVVPPPPTGIHAALEIGSGAATVIQKSAYGAVKCICGTAAIFVPFVNFVAVPIFYGSAGADFANAYYEGKGVYNRILGNHEVASEAFNISSKIDTIHDIIGGPTYFLLKKAGKREDEAYSIAESAANVSDLLTVFKSPSDILKYVKSVDKGSNVIKSLNALDAVDKTKKIDSEYHKYFDKTKTD